MAHFGHKKAKKVAQKFNMVFVQLYWNQTSLIDLKMLICLLN